MADLSTKYMGLDLRNPIIIGSSGLSDSQEKVKLLESKGAGAVVLKSIFEEEITNEYEYLLTEIKDSRQWDEGLDYLDMRMQKENLNKYLKLIDECKKTIKIPVIASINCVSSREWTHFAKKFEAAGADALELNVFVQPTDTEKDGAEIEKIYFDVIKKIKAELKIPVALKMSYFFSGLGKTIMDLSQTGIDSLVLFNRFFSPDIDIDNIEMVSGSVLSNQDDYTIPLRWIGSVAHKVKCDLAASTGIHSGDSLIKLLLAGADAAQVVSVLYTRGISHIETMLKELETWMDKNKFDTIDEFRGKLARRQLNNPAIYDRAQFMRYFGEYNK